MNENTMQIINVKNDEKSVRVEVGLISESNWVVIDAKTIPPLKNTFLHLSKDMVFSKAKVSIASNL